MEAMKPKQESPTDIAKRLSKIFDEHLNSLQLKRKTLIVLADGIWEGMKEEDKVGTQIVDFIKTLRDLEKQRRISEKWRFSIQFVRFGEDEKAINLLQRLDDTLKTKYQAQ